MTAFAAGSLEQAGDLQIMFGIGGERDLTERELPHLEGWRRSAPVRVGNGAWRQRQLDVYGELLSAVHRLSDRLFDTARVASGPRRSRTVGTRRPGSRRAPGRSSSSSPTPRRDAGTEKDHGIWEVRGEPRHFVYSKLMCWVALDRAIALADVARRRRPGPGVGAHAATRSVEAILREGWSDRVAGVHPILRLRRARRLQPDAAARRVPPRRRPEGAVDHRRHRGSAHRRTRTRVPLPRRTTVSTARRARSCCARSGWRRPWRWRAGPTGRAAVFERAAAFVNDVGLLAEEVDPITRRAPRQLPAGVQPHRPGQRGLGDLPRPRPRPRDRRGRQCPAAQPPSTCSVSPVTKPASSRYSTPPMMSSTPPSRPIGWTSARPS